MICLSSIIHLGVHLKEIIEISFFTSVKHIYLFLSRLLRQTTWREENADPNADKWRGRWMLTESKPLFRAATNITKQMTERKLTKPKLGKGEHET